MINRSEAWPHIEKRTEKAREKREKKAVRLLHERFELLKRLQDGNKILENDNDTFTKNIKKTEHLMEKVGDAVGETADETTDQLFG
ncbi:hypothetical protein KKC88_00970 [Patescibacteria group bacterium]|nr:hypothetical protein [Patescibacteria group bacterium]MBU1673331.1 hypothetical protein [Patescibacteria group bacterium]MBU1963550.1 hypothetical protein [Patescibacteria group bacterium]